MTQSRNHAWPADLTRGPIDLFRPRHLRGGAGAHLLGPSWASSAWRPSCRNSYRRSSLGAMPVVVTHRCQRRPACLREPLRASRLAAVLNERRGARHHLRLSQLELRSRGQPRPASLSQGSRRQGRHAGRLQARDHGPRKLRIATLGGLVFGTLSERAWLGDYLEDDRDPHPTGDAAPVKLSAADLRRPDAEALHGEREGLPREPAARSSHLPPEPPVAKAASS